MKFVLPEDSYEEKAKEYLREFREYQSDLVGCGGLEQYLDSDSFAAWTQKVMEDLDLSGIVPGHIPTYTYFYVREEDERLVGMVNIRLALTDFMEKEGGHIGYSIRPSERGRHYGIRLLKEALEFCRMLGLDEVILSCSKDNAASAKVIKNCGGQLEAEFYSDTFRDTIQRYRILQKNIEHIENDQI